MLSAAIPADTAEVLHDTQIVELDYSEESASEKADYIMGGENLDLCLELLVEKESTRAALQELLECYPVDSINGASVNKVCVLASHANDLIIAIKDELVTYLEGES